MSRSTAQPAPIVVVGSGLSGSLLALAIARRGGTVLLVGPSAADPHGPAVATGLSYGGLPAEALPQWRRLERQHGPLGLASSRLVVQGWPAGLDRLPPGLQALPTAPVPFGRVDSLRLATALPGALARAGVGRLPEVVRCLEQRPEGRWRLIGANGAPIGPEGISTLVLAAGAGCRNLWPALPRDLRFSWAGVIELEPDLLPNASKRNGWLRLGMDGAIVRPLRLRRPGLESEALQISEERWIVDGGLAPRGAGLLLGQITLVAPEMDPSSPPDPIAMEQRLRAGLACWDPELAGLPGRYRQVPVPYGLSGAPLASPVPEAAGLWIFSGFSGSFAVVPPLAEALAERLITWPTAG